MDEIDEIRQAYRRVFADEMAVKVLRDLAEYCNFLSYAADESDEGRRDVFLHILDMYGVEIPEVVSAIQKIPAHKKEEQEKTDNGE
jgi:hypothetical protein